MSLQALPNVVSDEAGSKETVCNEESSRRALTDETKLTPPADGGSHLRVGDLPLLGGRARVTMSGEVIAMLPRLVSRLGDDLRGDIIEWNGQIFDAAAVLDCTPASLVAEALTIRPRTAQAWWEELAHRWPGAAQDVIDRLQTDGNTTAEADAGPGITSDHRQEPARQSTQVISYLNAKRRSQSVHGMPTSRALVALAARLTPDEIGNVIDGLIDFLDQCQGVRVR